MGFEILKSRPVDDSIDIDALEKKYSFHLPPLYKLFSSCFYLGEEYIFVEKYWSKKHNDFFSLQSYNFYFGDENIGFSYFVPPEHAFEVYNSGSLSDFDYEQSYFPIAGSSGNGLYVGTRGELIDKIIWDSGNGRLVIAENVFEFVRSIHVTFIEKKYLYDEIDQSELYKKHSETFWRLAP